MRIAKIKKVEGEITVPGDKSISHRAVMIGSLAQGTTRVRNFLESADCLSTISCFSSMGLSIEKSGQEYLIHGKGLHGLNQAGRVMDAGNSGTTARLISGILAGQSFSSSLTGDASLCSRPMKRIMEPLREMGADIHSLNHDDRLPLIIEGRHLHGIAYQTKVASAQVKSCIILAGLYADGPSSVTEPALSRNHTEVMLKSFGAQISSENTTCTVMPQPLLKGQDIFVPGDISSAAYFLALGMLAPRGELLVKHVGINPTRDGFLKAARAMGADFDILDENHEAEPYADILVRPCRLHGVVIEKDMIPTLIDELPVLAVMAAFAQGTTIIRDAAELRVKESDRITAMTEGLQAMGADIEATEDGMIIHGGKALHGAEVDSFHDHRIAMALAVAGAVCEGELDIRQADCVSISYPGFYSDLFRFAK
ncbi:MAG: 3-phosphoshikimate 1-carboxyvinyltransferase [Blautia sp.]|nr:3-phosphoshikimate 1-carboxyvinyltransferase [Blautia sp.]